MILKEIIQRVQSLYSKGVHTGDSALSSRHIYNKILTTRSRLLLEQANKKQKISDWDYQTISCIELIVVPSHQCPCLPPIGCEMLRTKYKIPKTITTISSSSIRAVTSIEGSIRYSEVSLLERKYSKGNKYIKNKPDYFIQDGYLYITHPKGGPQVISLTGLFEDPIRVKEYETFCGDCVDCIPCQSYLDMDFPIDMNKLDLVVEFAVKELIEAFNAYGRRDNTTNSLDDNKPKE